MKAKEKTKFEHPNKYFFHEIECAAIIFMGSGVPTFSMVDLNGNGFDDVWEKIIPFLN